MYLDSFRQADGHCQHDVQLMSSSFHQPMGICFLKTNSTEAFEKMTPDPRDREQAQIAGLPTARVRMRRITNHWESAGSRWVVGALPDTNIMEGIHVTASPASVFWRADDDVGVIPSGETWRGAIGITVLKAHDGTQIVVFCVSDFVRNLDAMVTWNCLVFIDHQFSAEQECLVRRIALLLGFVSCALQVFEALTIWFGKECLEQPLGDEFWPKRPPKEVLRPLLRSARQPLWEVFGGTPEEFFGFTQCPTRTTLDMRCESISGGVMEESNGPVLERYFSDLCITGQTYTHLESVLRSSSPSSLPYHSNFTPAGSVHKSPSRLNLARLHHLNYGPPQASAQFSLSSRLQVVFKIILLSGIISSQQAQNSGSEGRSGRQVKARGKQAHNQRWRGADGVLTASSSALAKSARGDLAVTRERQRTDQPYVIS
ncbi:hypothetical protein B0H13DRAFT_2278218 [Mycena leptocephala]|nr:hypothetical protein B0H13DRAFT_2278218 [Mycena leptocephala]